MALTARTVYPVLLAAALLAPIGPATAEHQAATPTATPTAVEGTCAPTPAPTATGPVAPAPTATPAPTTAPTAPATAAFTDRTSVPFTAAGRSSNYHVWAAHIDRTRPVKLIVHFHGDGGYEHRAGTSSPVVRDYLALAKAQNAVLVIPKTPNTDMTWWKATVDADYAAGLISKLYTDYGVDRTKVTLSGFSGGSELLARNFMPKHYGLLTAGDLILTGGGGVYGQNLKPAATAIGNRVGVHYVIGSADTVGYNAVAAAERGITAYRAAGFTEVTKNVIPGKGHNAVAIDGPRLAAQYMNK